MNFAFSDEQQALRDQARKFLSDRAAPARVRRILESDEPFDRELWRGIGELAWTGTAIPESYGGAGFGYLELCVLAEELGRSLAPTPFSSSVYLATEALLLAGTDAQKKRWLPKLALGEAIGSLRPRRGPARAASRQPGSIGARRAPHRRQGAGGRRRRGRLRRGGGARRRRRAVAVPRRPRAARASRAVGWTPSTPRGPTRGSTFDGAAAEPLGEAGEGWPLLERLLDRAAVLFAFEQVGGAQAALEMARDYALGRFAFGRPIGSFQAIKHKLADVYVALELARSNAYYGAWALSTDAPELPVAAAAARVSAQRGLLPRRQGEHPDPRRHGLHLGVRLPHVLPPRQAARAEPRQRGALEGQAHRQTRIPQREPDRMDFNDTTEEATFRAEARAWLEATAERRAYPGETWKARFGETDGLARAKEFQAQEARRRLRRHHLADGVRRPRRHAHPAGDLQPGGVALPRARAATSRSASACASRR